MVNTGICGKCGHSEESHIPTHPKGFSQSRTMHCEECRKKHKFGRVYGCHGIAVSGSYYATVLWLGCNDNNTGFKEDKKPRMYTYDPIYFVNGEIGSSPDDIEERIEYDVMDWHEPKRKRYLKKVIKH